MNEVYGERREAMERVLGLQALRDSLSVRKPEDQVLAIDLRGRDPEAAFSEVPYEKGRLFLSFLEAKFGRERFDAFLRGYFDHFAFKSITTEQFLAYLKENLLRSISRRREPREVTQWVMSPGIPAGGGAARHRTPSSRWMRRGNSGSPARPPAKKLETRDWTAPQWLYFLDGMPAALSREQLADLDQAFKLTSGANSVVAARWYLLVIRNGYQPSYAASRAIPADSRAAQAHRSSVRGADENAGRRRVGEAGVRAGTTRLSPDGGRVHRSHRHSCFRVGR